MYTFQVSVSGQNIALPLSVLGGVNQSIQSNAPTSNQHVSHSTINQMHQPSNATLHLNPSINQGTNQQLGGTEQQPAHGNQLLSPINQPSNHMPQVPRGNTHTVARNLNLGSALNLGGATNIGRSVVGNTSSGEHVGVVGDNSASFPVLQQEADQAHAPGIHSSQRLQVRILSMLFDVKKI